MGEFALSKLQWGLEATRGTAVAADTMVLAAPMAINTDRKPFYPKDMVGIRARTTRSHIFEYMVRNALTFDAAHPAYFQILPMLFSCGLKGSVTPSEQTPAQADYLWTFTPSLTAANSPQTITLEGGDNVQAYEVEHVLFERFAISGEINQDGEASPVELTADFFGRQWTATTFTGSIAIPSTEIMNAKLAQLYLNVSWATIGNTEKTGLLRGFNVEILTGLHPKMTGSGNKYFDTYGEGFIDVLASFTFEGNSDADAIWDAFNAQTFQAIRLKISGAQIGTGVNHSLTLDIGGTWEEVIPMADVDKGNNLHTAVLHGKYDITGAKLLQVAVSTNVSAI